MKQQFIASGVYLLHPAIFTPWKMSISQNEKYSTNFILKDKDGFNFLQGYAKTSKNIEGLQYYHASSIHLPTITIEGERKGYQYLKEIKETCSLRQIRPDQFFADIRCDLVVTASEVKIPRFNYGEAYKTLTLNEVILKSNILEEILENVYQYKTTRT